MIIVKLLGGLGNQMFQYALGRRLAIERGIASKLDLNWYNSQSKRSYQLDHFKTQLSIALEEESYCVKYCSHNRLIRKLFTLIQKRIPYYKRRSVYEQRSFCFDDHILDVPDNCYLTGYWQSHKYFESIGEVLREEFALKETPNSTSIELSKEIQRVNSVSLHVRRGDYVTEPETHKHHGVLGVDYYRLAMKQIETQVFSPHYYVFSDDLRWVKENIKFVSPCTFVESNTANRDYEDMWLMSQCRHHITANSSFSWWGAWLGGDPEKIVIVPKHWLSDSNRETLDLIPETWIRIENE